MRWSVQAFINYNRSSGAATWQLNLASSGFTELTTAVQPNSPSNAAQVDIGSNMYWAIGACTQGNTSCTTQPGGPGLVWRNVQVAAANWHAPHTGMELGNLARSTLCNNRAKVAPPGNTVPGHLTADALILWAVTHGAPPGSASTWTSNVSARVAGGMDCN